MTLVLLPGLDGTGDLFADFVSALTPNLDARIVRYPKDRLLSYADLFSFVVSAIPENQPFVLLAESFSTPLAVRLAATNPASLKGLNDRWVCYARIKEVLQQRQSRLKDFIDDLSLNVKMAPFLFLAFTPSLFSAIPERFGLTRSVVGYLALACFCLLLAGLIGGSFRTSRGSLRKETA